MSSSKRNIPPTIFPLPSHSRPLTFLGSEGLHHYDDFFCPGLTTTCTFRWDGSRCAIQNDDDDNNNSNNNTRQRVCIFELGHSRESMCEGPGACSVFGRYHSFILLHITCEALADSARSELQTLALRLHQLLQHERQRLCQPSWPMSASTAFRSMPLRRVG